MWVRSLDWEDPPGGGHGNPLQYSCLENPTGRRAWGLQSVASQRLGLGWSTHTVCGNLQTPCLTAGGLHPPDLHSRLH